MPARRASTSLRLAVLLATVAGWLWLWSIHTPWATDLAPRLWLYDLLYYLRAALVAWVLAECALWAFHPLQRTRFASACLVATLALSAAAWIYAHASIGWRVRTRASAPALEALAMQGDGDRRQGDGDRRQRAGLVLVDSLRRPCDAATPWFWLGRPHGAGSGINLAIVRSDAPPQAPFAEAFRLRRIDAHWWMAYQDGRRYHALQGDAAAGECALARQIGSHRAGMAFIEAG